MIADLNVSGVLFTIEALHRQTFEAALANGNALLAQVKAFKTQLAFDRTSCSRATANQMRLFLHTAAYWLLWTLRFLAPKRSQLRKAQFDTIRLHLLKVAAKVTEYATQVVVQIPSAYPNQAIARLLGPKIPQLTTPP